MISRHLIHNTHSIPHTPPLLNPPVAISHDYPPTVSTCHIPPSPLILAPPPSTLDDILAKSKLPPPGPDYYAMRRQLWLSPRCAVEAPPLEPSASRQRLEKLLAPPDAAQSEEVWKSGVEKVWQGLNAGGKLKRRLPMALIVRQTFCFWSLAVFMKS